MSLETLEIASAKQDKKYAKMSAVKDKILETILSYEDLTLMNLKWILDTVKRELKYKKITFKNEENG